MLPESIKTNITDEMGNLFEQFGTNSILGRIFGLLLISEDPLSLEEIAQKLSLSKASISIQIRMLEEMGYCKKLPKTSDRKNYYILNENYLELTYLHRIKMQERYIMTVENILGKLPNNDLSYKLIKERLSQLKSFHEMIINTTLNAINQWKHKEK